MAFILCSLSFIAAMSSKSSIVNVELDGMQLDLDQVIAGKGLCCWMALTVMLAQDKMYYWVNLWSKKSCVLLGPVCFLVAIIYFFILFACYIEVILLYKICIVSANYPLISVIFYFPYIYLYHLLYNHLLPVSHHTQYNHSARNLASIISDLTQRERVSHGVDCSCVWAHTV